MTKKKLIDTLSNTEQMLIYDQKHAALVRRARNSFRFASTEEDTELFATSFAPCSDNGTAGKYYCRYQGHEFPRVEHLECIARDIAQDNRDSNGNQSCINETFKDVKHVAPFVDLDLMSDTVDGEWIRRFGKFAMDTLRECATKPLGPTAQVVITTMIDDEGRMRSFNVDFLKCPYCSAEVLERASTRFTHVCMDCNCKWKFVKRHDHHTKNDDVSDEEDVEGVFRLYMRGHGARGKRKIGDLQSTSVVANKEDVENDTCPQPKRVQSRKVSAHFRFQGVLMSKRTMLVFLHFLRLKAYAFDRTITPEEWDKAIDTTPNKQMQLRLTLTNKAAVCPTCKGRRTLLRDGTRVSCLRCFESGRIVIPSKRHEIFDVFYEHPPIDTNRSTLDDPEPSFLGDLVHAHEAAYEELWRQHSEDFDFILKLCSISVPIEGATVVEIRGSANAPVDVDVPQKSSRGRPVSSSSSSTSTVQARVWKSSTTQAKQYLSARLHETIQRLVAAINSQYAEVAVREAFYIDTAQTSIIVHIDGVGSTFCLNKHAQQQQQQQQRSADENSDTGFHKSSRAWAMIKYFPNGSCAIRMRCFNRAHTENPRTNSVSGCGKWKGTRWFSIPENVAVVLFPKQTLGSASNTRASTENGIVSVNFDGSVDNRAVGPSPPSLFETLSSDFKFLKSFKSVDAERTFLRELQRALAWDAQMTPSNVYQETIRVASIKDVLRFYDTHMFTTTSKKQSTSHRSLCGSSAIEKAEKAMKIRKKRERVIHDAIAAPYV